MRSSGVFSVWRWVSLALGGLLLWMCGFLFGRTTVHNFHAPAFPPCVASTTTNVGGAPRASGIVGYLLHPDAKAVAQLQAPVVNLSQHRKPFKDVLSAITLPKDILSAADEHANPYANDGIKAFIFPQPSTPCVVYGAGIDKDARFENHMTSLGCSVFAFDCTIDKLPVGSNADIHFESVCIGTGASFEDSKYAQGRTGFRFESLSSVMKRLNHDRVTILKMDIEGFEWDVLYSEIVHGTSRPEQLLFELHSFGANPKFVPAGVVRTRDEREVKRLFLELHHVGYRVFHKTINPFDAKCADFSLVYVGSP